MDTLVSAGRGVPCEIVKVGGAPCYFGGSTAGKFAPVRRRMLDMGFTRGAVVTVRKFAPLGDPVELRVRGCNVTLRRRDAALVEVRLLRSADTAPATTINGSTPVNGRVTARLYSRTTEVTA